MRKLPLYHQYMTYICFFFILYWFALFRKFGTCTPKILDAQLAHVVEQTKMLIELIVCKIMHCLDSQTVSKYISAIVPDDNEKQLINEKLDILLVLPVKVVLICKASNLLQ